MASNGEDDEMDDLEALRKAALATLKPKIQPIEQVISSNLSRTKTPEWSEVPASVDYPFSDPIPEPSPFPLLHHVPAAQSHPRQLTPHTWRGHVMNGIPTHHAHPAHGRFKFNAFQADRRPFQFHPRGSHRSFGDRGRPLYDRGRRVGRGFISNRGSFPLTNQNRSIPDSHLSAPSPAPQHRNPLLEQPVPVGGNLIVIQPHKPSADGVPSYNAQAPPPGNQRVGNASRENTTPLSTGPDNSTSLKAKLVLPQDRYHSSQSSVSREQTQKTVTPEPHKKPKDKFSRYDKSDSEDEDDSDNHSEADDIAEEIDKFLQDVDEDEAGEEEKDSTVKEDVPVTNAEDPANSAESHDQVAEEEEEEIPGLSSPVPSEAESLDLDALANGDPVIGDFEDLDFLVDREPVADSVSDTVRLMVSDVNQSDIRASASFSGNAVDKDRQTSPISSSSSLSSAFRSPPLENRGKDEISIERDKSASRNVVAKMSTSDPSKNTSDKVSHRKSKSPVLNSSAPSKTNISRSPCLDSRSSFRSRSPIRSRTAGSRRFSPPSGQSISPRRFPLGRHQSPLRGRSTHQRSLSPFNRTHLPSSPRRISSPPRQNASPVRRPLHPRRSASPYGRRRSPYRRSNSPHRTQRHRNDSRNRRDYELARRNGESVRQRGFSPSGGGLSSLSRSGERGRWLDSKGTSTSIPNHGDRRAAGSQHALRDHSSADSKSNSFHGKEDPSKGLFMDDKELEKLPPEERANLEARRRKFGNKEEVNLEDAKKTVSLKSIKERKKKSKKEEKAKDGTVNSTLEESVMKKKDKSGISLKALRKKMEQKKSKHEDEEISAPSLADLDDDSEDSSSGRAWKLEGNKSKSVKRLKPDTSTLNCRLNPVSQLRTKSHRIHDRPGDRHSEISNVQRHRLHENVHRRRKLSDDNDDNSESNIPSSRLGSHIVSANRYKRDIPPEKLRIQIQVTPKEKKKRKLKSKSDVTNAYPVPAKHARVDVELEVEEEEEEEEEKVVPKKKFKKEKKEKKKKSARESPEVDPTQTSRPSILERLGKKVELDLMEKKKKKKKSKQGHSDNGVRGDLDEHIEKMKMKNAAIERRQQEIRLDKERYG